MCQGAVLRSGGNLQESILSSIMWVPEVELRWSGVAEASLPAELPVWPQQ